MPLDTNVVLQVAATLTAALDLATGAAPLTYKKTFPLANGVLINQADRIFHDQRTLGPSATEDLDLAGSLLDAFGATITFARIKGMLIYAALANANPVVVGGAATNTFLTWVGAATHTVTVRPGGLLALIAPDATGYVVTPTTADLLRIGNGGAGTSVTYDLILIGASA